MGTTGTTRRKVDPFALGRSILAFVCDEDFEQVVVVHCATAFASEPGPEVRLVLEQGQRLPADDGQVSGAYPLRLRAFG